MESNGLPGGIFSRANSGMLGLEMSLHHHQNHLPSQNPNDLPPHHHHNHHHHPTVAYGHHESNDKPQTQQSMKQGHPFGPKAKNHSLTLSDDDEPGLTGEESAGDGKRKMSPWQRMKWTDNMVRLLIMVVFYIGDEAGSEGNNDPSGKKKGMVLQKKGKWKSVSRAMMERGFFVSPQQCEDKFNDLNKRYKRVNDILGKGTACRVVENQSLLETMDHLLPRMKEEVKKLLNSKHLFFREMCAYHNSCANGGGGGGGDGGTDGFHRSPGVTAEPPQNQQRCLHSSENIPIVPNFGRAETEGSKMAKGGSGEDDEEEEDDDEDNDDNDDEVVEGGVRGQERDYKQEDDTDERTFGKRPKMGTFTSPIMQQLSTDLLSVFQDGTKGSLEKRKWVKMRLLELEEQRLGYLMQAYELEKQRVKWLKFRTKKEREMEKEKLSNERMRVENERMILLLRQKELDLLDLQQQQHGLNKRMNE